VQQALLPGNVQTTKGQWGRLLCDSDTYQRYDVQHSRCKIRQPAGAEVVHCEIGSGLEENQVQENEDEKCFAGCKQLLQHRIKTDDTNTLTSKAFCSAYTSKKTISDMAIR